MNKKKLIIILGSLLIIGLTMAIFAAALLVNVPREETWGSLVSQDSQNDTPVVTTPPPKKSVAPLNSTPIRKIESSTKVESKPQVKKVAFDPTKYTDLSSDIRVRFLDYNTFCLAIDYDKFIVNKMFTEYGNKLKALDSLGKILPDWSRRSYYGNAIAETIIKYRVPLAEQLQDFDKYSMNFDDQSVPVKVIGYWLNATGQVEVPDLASSEMILTRNATMGFFVFVEVKDKLVANREYVLSLPTGDSVKINYNPKLDISYLFKINQVGYSPDSNQKYGYLGAWLGDGGAMDLSRYIGKKFYLIDSKNGAKVFEDTITKRLDDVEFKGGVPFTGEMVLELDFSKFKKVGEYYLMVDNLGRSRNFLIDNQAIGDSFFMHAKGLYHKRCGIEKKQPYTPWEMGACHLESYQGNYPPNEEHYKMDRKNERDFGFFDAKGQSINVKRFDLIKENLTNDEPQIDVYGGWHDAADYDRRMYHFVIANDLIASYLMFPENFKDKQLNIPESGNGIPDILDEALYGVEVWRKAQNEQGGVGCSLEATSHPAEYNPSIDKQKYYLALPSCESSLEYAAYASMLAVALKKANATKESQLYLNSAQKAYAYGTNLKNRLTKTYKYKKETITYKESMSLDPINLLKASLNLYKLTGDKKYLTELKNNLSAIEKALDNVYWQYSPMVAVELLDIDESIAELKNLKERYAKVLLKTADLWIERLNKNYPYRTLWYEADHGFVGYMTWGNVHPFKRARFFVIAWKLSGDDKYRDAAFLANDWHNGANPLGLTLTSKLGSVYPARFLDLPSYKDGINEFVGGISPYMFTFGVSSNDIELAHGLYYKAQPSHKFAPESYSLIPKRLGGSKEQSKEDAKTILMKSWPIWRRYVVLESYSVAASEYTVWETMGISAGVTGSLMGRNYMPKEERKNIKLVDDLHDLEGYKFLP